MATPNRVMIMGLPVAGDDNSYMLWMQCMDCKNSMAMGYSGVAPTVAMLLERVTAHHCGEDLWRPWSPDGDG